MQCGKKKYLFLIAFICLVFSFVYGKGDVEAAGNYYIRVNKGTNVATVYHNNGTPYRAFICSTGRATPLGTFYTSQKLRWHELIGPVYGQYCTRITQDILFHSVYYSGNGNHASQSYSAYNKLGTTASAGCVRLTVGDAKWIFDNCPIGTKVTVFYGNSSNDPLGKPQSIKVNASQGRGWDPTDPAPGNPYANQFPTIDTSAKAWQIQAGTEFNYVEGIVGRDSLGNDISGNLTYNGHVDTANIGTYTVTYDLRDALGRTAQKSVTYHVIDNESAILTGVETRVEKDYDTIMNLREGIYAHIAGNKDITDQITIKVKGPKETEATDFWDNDLKLKKTGVYYVYYSVTNPNNQQVTKATTRVVVKDKKVPELKGVEKEKSVEYNDILNLKTGVSANLVSGKKLNAKIKIYIKAPKYKNYRRLTYSGKQGANYRKYRFTKIGTYQVKYTVANPNNPEAVVTKNTKIQVVDTQPPVITNKKPYDNAIVGKAYNAYNGVTAKQLSGKKLKRDKMELVVYKLDTDGEVILSSATSITTGRYFFLEEGSYKILYRIYNGDKENEVSATEQRTVMVEAEKVDTLE